MASHLYLVLLAAVVALSNGLECNNHLSITCGEHSGVNDLLCDQLEKQAYGAADETLKCPDTGGMNKCATGEIQYNQAETNLSVKVSFASCGMGESECFTDLKALDDNELGIGLSTVLTSLGSTLTAGKTEICFCDMDKCNGALSMVAHTSVVVISLFLIIML
ncbi:uncharacterized protein [Apostichopus japonicus]|uniref:uncharacterized protein n=1 Tax=Stichopus japonicus TaxID=307972 RepID=UPI003AB70FB0